VSAEGSGVRVGLTLPSFVRDVDEVLTVAVAAEAAGLDGVFVYDHLFRFAADGARRPALEFTALLGAVAGATSRVHVGPLVARATLRPHAITALTFATAQRLAGDRFIGALGAGDHESKGENETYVTSSDVKVFIGGGRPAEISHLITRDDGSTLSAQELVRDAFAAWQTILRRNKLLV